MTSLSCSLAAGIPLHPLYSVYNKEQMPVSYDAVIPSRGSRDVKSQRQSLSSVWSYLNRGVELQPCHAKVTLLNTRESAFFLASFLLFLLSI